MPLKLPENRNFFLWIGLGGVFFSGLSIILKLPSAFGQTITIVAIIIMCFHVFPSSQWLLKKLLDLINTFLDRRCD